MTKRERIQAEAIEDILEHASEGNVRFVEIPTGAGKTRIALEGAKALVEKLGRSVVVTTANNLLVKGFYDEIAKAGLDYRDYEIAVGKDRYVNPETVTSKEFLERYELGEGNVKSWLDANGDFAVAEIFVDAFSLPEETVDEIRAATSKRSVVELMKRMGEEKKVFLTNYVFLLSMISMAKRRNEEFSFPVIADEVHALEDAGRMFFERRFSSFRLSYLLKRIEKKAKMTKKEERIVRECRKLFFDLAELPTKCDGDVKIVDSAFRRLMSSKKTETLAEVLKKIDSADAEEALGTLSEGKAIASNDGRSVDLSFVKRYPTFSVITTTPRRGLESLLRVRGGYFFGMSGTIRVAKTESVSGNEWSFERLGFSLNGNGKSLSFKVYPRIFPRDSIRYLTVEGERYAVPGGYSEPGFKKSYALWIENLADLFVENLWGNSLVLMGSQENAESFGRLLSSRKELSDYEIFVHGFGVSPSILVSEYKRSVDSGKPSILVGGLVFYTGIDLGGKYLDTLFIGKLPMEKISPVGGWSWKDAEKRGVIFFRQGLGRAVRSEEDRCFVVVADPRIHANRYASFKAFLEESGYPLNE